LRRTRYTAWGRWRGVFVGERIIEIVHLIIAAGIGHLSFRLANALDRGIRRDRTCLHARTGVTRDGARCGTG
jgi:hypothetical protein